RRHRLRAARATLGPRTRPPGPQSPCRPRPRPGSHAHDRLGAGPRHDNPSAWADLVIRVLVADDHAVVRSGLEELLRGPDDIDFVGSYSDGESTIQAAQEQRPDVVLMDLQMPGVDGIQATSRLRELLPEIQVVVLTSFSDRERILAALEAGAVGYLLKDA